LRSSPGDLLPLVEPLHLCHAPDFTHRFPQKGEKMILWISIVSTNTSLLRRKVDCPQATIIPESSFQMVSFSLIVKIMQADTNKAALSTKQHFRATETRRFFPYCPAKETEYCLIAGIARHDLNTAS
jgi:hypothetical protein